MLVDTHSHLYTEQFDDDRHATVKRALDAGVQKIILPNIDEKSLGAVWDLTEAFPEHCFPTVGIHPCDVAEDYQSQLQFMERELAARKYCAIGETGIDLYWDKTTLQRQIKAFEWQIEKAKELNLPIIIHARDSFDEIFEVLDRTQDGRLRGVFHCFTGDEAQAERAINLGLHLGLGGVLTFKKSKLPAVIEKVDIQHIVLETDSPYLAPTPKRGKRNESAYIKYVAEKLAEIKNRPIEWVEEHTTRNAERLFGV